MNTKKFGLIGNPLGHSLSPLIHRRIMEISGIDGSYEMHDIPATELPHLIPRLMNELDGFNCTIPHKTALLHYMGSLDESARLCGAVNTVFRNRGYNTDTEGFKSAGIDLRGKNVLLLGAGGSAHMMAAVCLEAGAESIEINARSPGSAAKLSAHLSATFPKAATRVTTSSGAPATTSADVILNATPLGMWPKVYGLPCDPDILTPGAVVFDPVYNPTPSRLVLNARKRGVRAIGGLRMLLRQGIEAQRIWNPGLAFDIAAIEAEVLPEMLRELYKSFPIKILLTGFMGSGKSTVGKLLANKLGIAFADIDVEIERLARRHIPEIFAERGEQGFRKLETAVAESALRRGGSAVLAAGGGFPCREENRNLVRETNTLVLHLDAPFEILWSRISHDTSRPLARERGQTEELYNTRASLYSDFCDYVFDASLPPTELAETIARLTTDME